MIAIIHHHVGRIIATTVIICLIAAVYLGCKQSVLKLKCSGTVTDLYTQVPITSGFVILAPFQYDFNNWNSDYSTHIYQEGGLKYGAVVNPDGTYDVSIEEKNNHFDDEWHVVFYDDKYISDTYTLISGKDAVINISCKPYKTLCLRIDVSNFSSNQLSLDIFTDRKIHWYDTLFASSIAPFSVLDDTLYFKVIPEATTVISAFQSPNSFLDSVVILNSDTTFFDILIN